MVVCVSNSLATCPASRLRLVFTVIQTFERKETQITVMKHATKDYRMLYDSLEHLRSFTQISPLYSIN